MQRLSLVQHYADREGMSYDEAEALLLEEAMAHDTAEDLLAELGFEHDYTWDAVQLLQEAQS